MESKILRSKIETAKAISISPRTLDNLVRDGKVPSVRIGTRRLFDLDDVTAALKSGCAAPAAGK